MRYNALIKTENDNIIVSVLFANFNICNKIIYLFKENSKSANILKFYSNKISHKMNK